VNCLRLQVLNCLNCEDGGSNVQRYLIIVYQSAWNDILIDFNVKQFVGNKLEYYRKILLLVILKKILTNPRDLVYVTKVSTNF